MSVGKAHDRTRPKVVYVGEVEGGADHAPTMLAKLTVGP